MRYFGSYSCDVLNWAKKYESHKVRVPFWLIDSIIDK